MHTCISRAVHCRSVCSNQGLGSFTAVWQTLRRSFVSMCVCVGFTVCGHAARSAICFLSVLHKASLSKQATAGEQLVLMGYPRQLNPVFLLSLSFSSCWGCASHSPIFPTSFPPVSSLLPLSSLLSVQRPMGGLNPTMPFSSPLRLTLTKLSARALVMDVVLYSVCVCECVC